nr:hypothetical protein Q903MT_gene1347 [Picea sitchensis]
MSKPMLFPSKDDHPDQYHQRLLLSFLLLLNQAFMFIRTFSAAFT